MITLVWLGVIAVVVVGVVLVVRQSQGRLTNQGDRAQLPSLARTIFTLEVGDIVQYMGTDWVVEGKLTYDSNGYTWLEYLLQDGDRLRWLSVEEDDQVEVNFLEPTQGLDIPSTPPTHLTFGGVAYRQVEAGTARMTRVGTTLNRQAEQCRYFDYAASDDASDHQVLSVEDWEGDLEITVGTRIRPTALTLLPGDGRRVYGV
uniref:DUF4178 domain-containing protein n=1 Tax=Trichocoleus desertorum TaxID=1481672 RepID=UPI0025B3EC14|nr:DUF4178 domain-containing protein [Trichocoleus desertorum]